jgi:oligopeptide/dipeptide ABC transporter ATP-binding protein
VTVTGAEPVLEVRGLTVEFPTEAGMLQAVRGVDFEVTPGQVVGLVGESGAGKTVMALAVMGLLPRWARVSGSVRFRGRELLGLSARQLNDVRGRHLTMVFQDPSSSLNPVYTIGTQVAEAVRLHQPVTRDAARQQAEQLLAQVGMADAGAAARRYPHELSGGMRQRVVIAMAIANHPDVVLADEPTTALDVTIQAQVLDTLRAACRESGAAVVLVSHDLGVVAGMADEVLVMYAGRIVERGRPDDLYRAPRMPYTAGLLGSRPERATTRGDRLTPIPGTPPSPLALPSGCSFRPRCPLARDRCAEEEPPLLPTESTLHLAACHFWRELAAVEHPEELFRPVVGSDGG